MVRENILVVNNFHPETLKTMSKRYPLASSVEIEEEKPKRFDSISERAV